ncbi:MAG TPA: prolyl oligopeptidase family serine peptidase [Mycobacteriales bacterium]|jgi:dipeptidyl aminopeptidase/acylaminoacyl peptidase|nr:prolyl oligopeptidase family serine peptidase [Mycobacteriales bacterium]
MTPLPCGAWPSPLSAADVAAGTVALAWPRLQGDEVWWTEGRPAEGGRSVVVRRRADGAVEDVLPAPWNARTRVHEYGGNPWTVADGALVFASFADQRLWRLHPGGDPVALTPEPAEPAGDRYADLLVVAGEVWCVRERHAAGGVTRAIVAVPLDGSAQVRELVSGSDFLAHPRLSPDGRHLAWVAWDHPRMPWDGTELRVAAVTDWRPRTLLGGPTESVLQPEWLDATTLAAATDRSGWWNLVRAGLDGAVEPLLEADTELAGPLWQLGSIWYVVLDDGRLVAQHGERLAVLEDGVLRDLDLPQTSWTPALATDGRRLVAVAGSPTTAPAVVVVDPAGAHEVVHVGAAVPVGPEWLPVPTRESFPSAGGRVVHALVYPPTSPRACVPAGELPPYVVFVHGGPTSRAQAGLSLGKAYFTSRGIGVVDVDYGGSTGYGRAYRDALRGQWGVVDVEDCVAAARGLADAGRADGDRLVIRGGSAGGWTVLSALTRTDAFAAGASYYGVAELVRFAQDTHDFESRYLDALIGPLPEALELYTERAPLSHVDGLSCPVLLLQGDEDRVVPPSQSELFRDALVRKHIPHAYMLFEGEQHGFRKAETTIAALEAELSFYGQVLGFTPPDVPVLPLER